MRRIFGHRSEEMLRLAGSTVRNVSRGVVGISLVQSFLAGLGFLAVGIPGAGFFSFIALVLGIIQIGPTILFIPIVLWSWTTLDTTNALIFTAYMVAVGLIDNVLRPFVMAHGLATPMPIIFIGVVGGTLAYGISGLFLGPIVLSVTWAGYRTTVLRHDSGMGVRLAELDERTTRLPAGAQNAGVKGVKRVPALQTF